MDKPYAAVFGEALWDLLDRPEQRVFAQTPGGSCLNVAVGIARLGHPVEFVGAFGDDVLADRLRDDIRREGISVSACQTVPAQSTLAVTTFDGAEPRFTFYGHPAAHLALTRSAVSDRVAAGARVVHAGSIALLSPTVRDAVRSAYQHTRGWRTLDPNIRADLIDDPESFRRAFEALAAQVNLVKLSLADAAELYPDQPEAAPHRLLALGASAVLLTEGAAGARLCTASYEVRAASRVTNTIDATGAGDAVMVGVIDRILDAGWPADRPEWTDTVGYAMDVAAVVCGRPGGADAMPTRAQLRTEATAG